MARTCTKYNKTYTLIVNTYVQHIISFLDIKRCAIYLFLIKLSLHQFMIFLHFYKLWAFCRSLCSRL